MLLALMNMIYKIMVGGKKQYFLIMYNKKRMVVDPVM